MANTTKQKTTKPKRLRGLGERKKVGEEIFTKKSCHNSEESAKSAADTMKVTHRTRVYKDPETQKFCMFAKKK